MRHLLLLLSLAGLCLASDKPKVHTFQADEATVWSAVKTVVVRNYTLLNKDDGLNTLTAEYSVHGDRYDIGITVAAKGSVATDVSMCFTEMLDTAYKWGRQGSIAKHFFADISAQLAKPQ
jgi:hypothetical protein